MVRMRALGIAVLPVLAGCETYAQHRAALVPHATPLPTNGQPMDSRGELALGASNVVDRVKPGVGDPDAGVAVPSAQLRGSLAVRVTKDFSIAGVYERGFAAGATKIKPSAPPVDGGDVDGRGVNLTYSIPTGQEGWRVGVSAELLVWLVPWVQYTTCIDNCSVPGFTYMDRGKAPVATLGLGITPSYRSGRVTVFGGVLGRNHPTLTEKLVTEAPGPADVRSGPANFTFHLGADVELGAGVRASLIMHQTIPNNPVAYGLGLGAMLTIPLGRDAAARPAPPRSGPPGVTSPVP
jgi:hypothetical protein